jgi:predicted glycoside hydrolase/deacetylase ChbG (UPF0249 family)
MNKQRGLAIIVTADDFGFGLRTSEGIIQAHRDGPVTATSMMTVTGDHAAASADLLADAPALEVGLHLVLTRCGHRPLVATASSGFADDDGFVGNGQLWIRAMTGGLDRRAVSDEIAAQAELFRKLAGRAPAFVDAHHHAHQLPVIREALLDVIGQGLLPRITRTTLEPPGWMRAIPGKRPRRCAAHFLGKRARTLFSRRGVWTNDFYFGMIEPRCLRSPGPWDPYIQRLPETGVVEWVVHPGLPDETLRGRDLYIAERPLELQRLTDSVNALAWHHLRPFLTRKSAVAAHSAEREIAAPVPISYDPLLRRQCRSS